MTSRLETWLVMGWSVFCLTTESRAQLTEPVQEEVEFRFPNPGARSLGFGGAFAGLADDATAAFTNPAGLVQLSKPEVSFEVRGQADLSFLENSSPDASSVPNASGLGFLSFVYPRGDWSFAVYWHQLANVEDISASQVLAGSNATGTNSTTVSQRTAELDLATYAVSAAYRPQENLSVGLGLAYYRGNLRSKTDFFSIDRATFLPGDLTQSRMIEVDSSDWGWSAGFLWHVTDQWGLGGVYRQAPSFDGSVAVSRNEAPAETRRGSARFPDVFGMGTVYKTKGGNITASAEWDHVRFSMVSTGIFDNIHLDDGDEIHLGFEYAFIGITPVIALRSGAWREPARRIRYVGEETLPDGEIQGAERWHASLGIGFAFGRFQIDMGFDVSEFLLTGALSGIVSF